MSFGKKKNEFCRNVLFNENEDIGVELTTLIHHLIINIKKNLTFLIDGEQNCKGKLIKLYLSFNPFPNSKFLPNYPA